MSSDGAPSDSPDTGAHAARGPLSLTDGRRLLGLVVLLVVGALLVRALETTLLLFAVVFLLAMVLNPLVVWLEKRCGLRRGLAVAAIGLAALGILALLGWLAVPPLLEQTGEFLRGVPANWQHIRAGAQGWFERHPAVRDTLPEDPGDLLGTAATQAGGAAKFLLRSTFGVVGGIFALLVALLLLAFTLSDPQPLVARFLELVPARHRQPAARALVRLMEQMTAWARGVAINGAITGVSTGALLWVIGVQPALVFGALAFLGEFVPNIGPILVAVPALFVALSLGTGKFWLTLLAILFVQQIESNLLVPFVMGKELKLHPVTILFFTLAMASLFGLAGAILALPAAALTRILLDEFYLRPSHRADARGIDQQAARIVGGEGPAAN